MVINEAYAQGKDLHRMMSAKMTGKPESVITKAESTAGKGVNFGLLFGGEAFAELYHARWRIEEAFKALKHRLYLEQFTGELPKSIRRHILVKLFTTNFAKALARKAYDSLPPEKADRYFPNVTYILHSLKYRLFGWLIQHVPPEQVLKLIALYAKTLERKRPDRKAPRPNNHASPKPRRQYR